MTTIRAAEVTDAQAIALLLGQLGYPTTAADIPARVAAVEHERGIVIVAADEDNRVIGLASGSRHTPLHMADPVAYITALVTDADARGLGVGRMLVEELERWASSNGCARISLTSAEHRTDAHAFYPRCGFPYTGRRFSKNLAAPAP